MKYFISVFLGACLVFLAYEKDAVVQVIYEHVTDQISDESNKQLFEEEYLFTNQQIPRFLYCSNGALEFIPLNGDFKEFLIISNKLDEKCFEEVSRQTSNYFYKINQDDDKDLIPEPESDPFNLDFYQRKNKKDGLYYAIAKTISPMPTCFSDCSVDLIKIAETYFFLSYPSDHGIKANLISKDIIIFKIEMNTHQRNVVFNLKERTLNSLPNGELSFSSDSVLVHAQKSYLRHGGAFWYDSKLDYSGKLLDLIDISTGTCIDREKFHERLEIFLIRADRSQLCVER